MRKYSFIFLVLFLSSAFPPLGTAQREGERSDGPSVIKSPSSIGEVVFPHRQHFEEFEIECGECHHAIRATQRETPHREYFDDFWIDCRICHSRSPSGDRAVQSCSECHHRSPAGASDEILSARVAIHEKCWECHGTDKGAEASRNCRFCHSGTRVGFKPDQGSK